jgi:lycopene cyclase domain-containing protein
MSLYLAVELCALAIPLAFSFDRKVAYFRMWPFLLPSIMINAVIFISLDIYFTSRGVWGFNPEYHSRIMIAGLPLEEILFFIIIPYCSLFIHYVFIAYLPGAAIKRRISGIISALLIVSLLLTAGLNLSRSYTSFYSILTAGLILIAWITNPAMLSRFYITFLIIMVPFLLVNSILTGSFIEGEVFWYDSNEITGIRLFSIPVEDVLFGFSLILLNLLVAERLRKVMKR